MATRTSARRRRAPKTIDEYIDRCAPLAQPILRRVRATIAQAAPDATETISYGIGHHAGGALGLDPLDRLNQKP